MAERPAINPKDVPMTDPLDLDWPDAYPPDEPDQGNDQSQEQDE